jgi:C-terminal processing protease CtpA/Prc
MVNLDMVGRLRDNELTIYGTGSAPTFDDLVERANEGYEFNLFKVPSGYGPSDHQSFYTAGVPVLFFFTGLHDNYHRPTDDFDKIEFGGLTRITDIVSDVTYELATLEQRPTYAETEKQVRVRRQITAYMGVSLANSEGSVVISGLVEGAPAERAGLKAGDLLKKLGENPVKNSQQVLELMRSRSPGQKMPVTVVRDGGSISLTIDLVARPDG